FRGGSFIGTSDGANASVRPGLLNDPVNYSARVVEGCFSIPHGAEGGTGATFVNHYAGESVICPERLEAGNAPVNGAAAVAGDFHDGRKFAARWQVFGQQDIDGNPDSVVHWNVER